MTLLVLRKRGRTGTARVDVSLLLFPSVLDRPLAQVLAQAYTKPSTSSLGARPLRNMVDVYTWPLRRQDPFLRGCWIRE